MTRPDDFSGLARYYDHLMSHVNYGRWYLVVTELAPLLPMPFRHLDAACGTGTLLRALRRAGWDSVGIDLSASMLAQVRANKPVVPVVRADLRRLPWKPCFNLTTCLFDSLNFVLDPGEMRRAVAELAATLDEGGLLYCDIVTERMVLDHFADQEWVERNAGFSTRWSSRYSRTTRISETDVRINSGPVYTFRERMYTREDVEEALAAAGLTLLGAYDAETWRAARARSIRIDFVAVKGESAGPSARAFEKAAARIRRMMV